MRWGPRFALDVAVVSFGLVIAVAGILSAVEGVEQSRLWLVEGEDVRTWLALSAARMPGLLGASLPVVGCLATALVTLIWRRSGRLVTLQTLGISPIYLMFWAMVGVSVLVATGAGLREVVAPWSSAVLAGTGGWVVTSDGDETSVFRGRLASGEARDVVVAWQVEGKLVGLGQAHRASWTEEGWQMEAQVYRWDSSRPMRSSLPSPEAWRQQALRLDPAAPVGRLWRAQSSPRRSAWLAERLASPVGTLLLAMLAVPAVARGSTQGVLGVTALAVGWRALQGGLIATAARAQLPLGIALLVPLLIVGLAVVLSGLWLHRTIGSDPR